MNDTLKELLRQSCKRMDVDFDKLDFSQKSDKPQFHCDTCHDLGYIKYDVPVGHPMFNHVVECTNEECQAVTNVRQARVRRLANMSQLPIEYRQWTFADWQELLDADGKLTVEERKFRGQMNGKYFGLGSAWAFAESHKAGYWFTLQDAVDVIKRPIPGKLPETRKNSLVLQGAPGIGKTSLAACVVNYLLAANVPVIYARVNDVLNAIKERFDRAQDVAYEYDYGNSAEAVKATFKRAPVLVLDEFNLTKYSDFDKQTMEDVMRYRMMHHLPTVITCNISFDQFQDEKEGWGFRCGHAVQQMAHWIEMSGVELRERNRAVRSA